MSYLLISSEIRLVEEEELWWWVVWMFPMRLWDELFLVKFANEKKPDRLTDRPTD